MAGPTTLVSVVIPVRNGEDHLAESIASVLAQSHEDLELVVVDDSSHDATHEIAQSFDDPRLSILSITSVGPGSSAPRNVGIAASTGSLIAVLDHDDVARPDRLAKQVERFAGDPSLVLLGGQALRTTEAGAALDVWRMPTGKRAVLRSLRWRCPFVHSTVMYRRSAFDAVGGYDEHAVLAQDHLLWLRLAAVGDVDNLGDVLSTYRLHDDQTTENHLLAPSDKRGIAEARHDLAVARGESVRMADLRQRVWVLRHAQRAFRRVLRT
jgi:glycosyltransferase involved in cell wall biosynthesis